MCFLHTQMETKTINSVVLPLDVIYKIVDFLDTLDDIVCFKATCKYLFEESITISKRSFPFIMNLNQSNSHLDKINILYKAILNSKLIISSDDTFGINLTLIPLTNEKNIIREIFQNGLIKLLEPHTKHLRCPLDYLHYLFHPHLSKKIFPNVSKLTIDKFDHKDHVITDIFSLVKNFPLLKILTIKNINFSFFDTNTQSIKILDASLDILNIINCNNFPFGLLNKLDIKYAYFYKTMCATNNEDVRLADNLIVYKPHLDYINNIYPKIIPSFKAKGGILSIIKKY
jgi:hypothetical protein